VVSMFTLAPESVAPKSPRSVAEWSTPIWKRRLMMNVQQTTGVRELTAEELDQVTGAMSADTWEFLWTMGASATAALGISAVIGTIIDWLFD
jgi:hypothetical protein